MAEMKVPVAKIPGASKAMAPKQLYVIVATPAQGLDTVLKNLDEHLKFPRDLERHGITFAAGPMWDDDETHCAGDSMVMVRAESLAAPRAIAAEDPMAQERGTPVYGATLAPHERTLTVRPNFPA